MSEVSGHESPEEIRAEIEKTRAELALKLEALQSEVRGTVEDAKSTLQETVDGVKKNLTLSHHVQAHPWMFFGGAVGTGVLLGHLLFHHSDESSQQIARFPRQGMFDGSAQSLAVGQNGSSASTPPNRHAGDGVSHPSLLSFLPDSSTILAKATPALSGLTALLLKTFSKEIQEGKKLAIGTALGIVRELVKTAVPAAASERTAEVIDQFTRNLGGEPLPAHQSHVTVSAPSARTYRAGSI